MMGPKTLNEIREELRYFLSKDGEDPVEWVEKRMAAGRQDSDVLNSILALLKAPGGPQKPKAKPAMDKAHKVNEELKSLQRFLEGPKKPKRRPKKARPAKKR